MTDYFYDDRVFTNFNIRKPFNKILKQKEINPIKNEEQPPKKENFCSMNFSFIRFFLMLFVVLIIYFILKNKLKIKILN